MTYIKNPKLEGSGLVGCIPQKGRCPNNCPDCFFQSGRSYLEPLKENLPNMPPYDIFQVVRVNDGNDSSVDFDLVCNETARYPRKFFNTSTACYLPQFPGPVVLTVNPSRTTNWAYTRLTTIPRNLMFVRILTNTWNLPVVHGAVEWYVSKKVPCVLTFMAYHDIESIPRPHRDNYVYRKRTLNSYYVIKSSSWAPIMTRFLKDPFVHSCGSEGISSLCRHCGNCLREYFTTMERLNETG